MKQVVVLSCLLMILGVSAVSADANTWAKPGTVTAQAGVGIYWGGLGQLSGGVDVGLGQVVFAPTFPVDFGVAGRVALTTGALGASAYGTASYSWRALRTGQAWVDNLETYLGLGVAILPNLGLDGLGGVAYHFNNQWAVFVEGAQFGSVLGAAFRF